MNRVLVIGVNHGTAPLDLRERLAFTPDAQAEALAELRRRYPHAEAALLSTCNRVEFYLAREPHESPRVEELIEWWAGRSGVPVERVRAAAYHKANRQAVDHVFRVASSLDSMVQGETQILGQFREAYELAASCGACGPTLNPLMQRAIAVGKQVMTRTPLAEGRLSVASIAVDCARGIFDHFADKTLLCVGAGRMATLVLRGLAQLGCGRLLVCNRDPARAAALCERFGGELADFDRLDEHLMRADIVITSTGSRQPILTAGRFEAIARGRRYRPIFLIDIAVPRDVEASVGELEGVYLYNLDDLQKVAAATQASRAGAVEQASAIVREAVDAYAAWHRAREVGPVIDRLYRRYHRLADAEADRIAGKLPGLAPSDRELLRRLARRVVNKLLHDPIRTLKAADSLHAPTIQYLHALEKLFHLDGPDEDPGGGDPTQTPPEEPLGPTPNKADPDA